MNQRNLAVLALVVGSMSTSIANADEFDSRDALAIDAVALHEPGAGVGWGILLRYQSFWSELPRWLGTEFRGGFVSSARDPGDIGGLYTVGLVIKPVAWGPQAFMGGGLQLTSGHAMDDAMHAYWVSSASLGWQHRGWDLRASLLISDAVEDRHVWMISLGRDLRRVHQHVTTTSD